MALGLVSAVVGLTSGLALGAAAPRVVDGLRGNLHCSDLQGQFSGGRQWRELHVSRPRNGTFSDGPLTVTISNDNFKKFDWASNRGVDAVYVDAGPDSGPSSANRLYIYDPPGPPSHGDTDVTGSAPKSPENLAFCYHVEATTSPTATTAPLVTSTTTTSTTVAPGAVSTPPAPGEASTPPAPGAQVLAISEVRPEVQAAQAVSAGTLPRTGRGLSALLWVAGVLLVLGGLALRLEEVDQVEADAGR